MLRYLLLILMLMAASCDFVADYLVDHQFLESEDVVGTWIRVERRSLAVIGGDVIYKDDTTIYRIGLDKLTDTDFGTDYSHKYRSPRSFYVSKDGDDERGYLYAYQGVDDDYEFYDMDCSCIRDSLKVLPGDRYETINFCMPVRDSLWVTRSSESFGLRRGGQK